MAVNEVCLIHCAIPRDVHLASKGQCSGKERLAAIPAILATAFEGSCLAVALL